MSDERELVAVPFKVDPVLGEDAEVAYYADWVVIRDGSGREVARVGYRKSRHGVVLEGLDASDEVRGLLAEAVVTGLNAIWETSPDRVALSTRRHPVDTSGPS